MDLDLDIHNYTIKDIEKFFRFHKQKKYSAEDVEQREYKMREQLLNSGHIDKRFKKDFIDFLEKAKQILITAKCNSDIPPTAIPKNYQLDKFPNVPLSKEPPSRVEELVQRPTTQYIYAQNSDFLPGVINPLTTRIITKCLNIDSRFRDNIYTTQCSDFTLHLPTRLSKVVSMQLSSLEIPITFYGISEKNGNNHWYMSVKYSVKNTVQQILVSDEQIQNPDELKEESKICIVPEGNYNALDFVDLLNTTMSTNVTDTSFTIFSYLKFSLNATTSGSGTAKLSLDASGLTQDLHVTNIIMDFRRDIHGNIDKTPVSSRIGWNMGFIKPLYEGQIHYIADSIIEPATMRYFYLVVDDFNHNANNHFIGVFQKSMLSPNILARISLKCSYFNILMESDYTVVSEPRKYFGPVDIQKLRIQLIDEYGNILNMNNANFSFSLVLKMVYDL